MTKLQLDGSVIFNIAFSETTMTLCNQQNFKDYVIQPALAAIDSTQTEYKLYLNNIKKYKILKTNKFKGNKRMINTQNSKPISKNNSDIKLKDIKYKIVESGAINITEYWCDNNLLVEPYKNCKQIYIICN